MYETARVSNTGLQLYPVQRSADSAARQYTGQKTAQKTAQKTEQKTGVHTVRNTDRHTTRRGGRSVTTVRNSLGSRFALIVVGLALLLIGAAVLFMGSSNAPSDVEAATVQEKYYTSIRVKSGDTLWSLAEEYGARYQDYDVFIKEVQNINHLDGDKITYGAYLFIPVYR